MGITIILLVVFILLCKYDTDKKLSKIDKKLDDFIEFETMLKKVNDLQININTMNREFEKRGGGGAPSPPPKPPTTK